MSEPMLIKKKEIIGSWKDFNFENDFKISIIKYLGNE
jgi:hypothetical protein